MAAFDDVAAESFFEREKERLIQEISSVSRGLTARCEGDESVEAEV